MLFYNLCAAAVLFVEEVLVLCTTGLFNGVSNIFYYLFSDEMTPVLEAISDSNCASTAMGEIKAVASLDSELHTVIDSTSSACPSPVGH